MVYDWGEFKVGHKVKTQGRTITESDFCGIVNLTWENGPLHTDDEYMKTTRFGRRILGGPCIIALMAGLVTTPLHSMMGRAHLNTIAALGLDNVRYLGPLQVGDTLSVEIEVLDLRETRSKPGRLVGRIKEHAVKQDSQPVLEMEAIYLFERT